MGGGEDLGWNVVAMFLEVREHCGDFGLYGDAGFYLLCVFSAVGRSSKQLWNEASYGAENDDSMCKVFLVQ